MGHIERSVYAVIVHFSQQGQTAVTDPCIPSLGDEDRDTLIQVARNAISHELYQHVPMEADVDRFALALRQTRATFVTLQIDGQLRGCMGTLEARRPLVLDVALNPIHNAGWAVPSREAGVALTAAQGVWPGEWRLTSSRRAGSSGSVLI